IRAGSLVVWLRLNVSGFRPVLARGWHGAASSSRSQLAGRTASSASSLTWQPPSVNVRWRPPLVVAIVTHLVTRPVMSAELDGSEGRTHHCANHDLVVAGDPLPVCLRRSQTREAAR